MMSKLKSGMIPAGTECPFQNKCGLKDKACNGEGCQVSDGKIQSIDFSCGLARGFDIAFKRDC
jgi:hypothetical protein